MTPDATRREALYIETRWLDFETKADSKRLNIKARINKEKSKLMAQVLSNPECMWEIDTAIKTMAKYEVTNGNLKSNKFQTKAAIKRA